MRLKVVVVLLISLGFLLNTYFCHTVSLSVMKLKSVFPKHIQSTFWPNWVKHSVLKLIVSINIGPIAMPLVQNSPTHPSAPLTHTHPIPIHLPPHPVTTIQTSLTTHPTYFNIPTHTLPQASLPHPGGGGGRSTLGYAPCATKKTILFSLAFTERPPFLPTFTQWPPIF